MALKDKYWNWIIEILWLILATAWAWIGVLGGVLEGKKYGS